MDKRCLIITYYFPPAGGGGVQRILKLVKYLSRQNWHFKLIVAVSGQGAHSLRDESLLSEIPASLEIVSVDDPFARVQKGRLRKLKSTFVLRWLSSLFFIPDIRKSWSDRAERKALDIIREEPFDCILVSSPPYSLATAAARLRQNSNIPVVLDMRDPWVINPYKIYPSPLHKFLDVRHERAAIRGIEYGVSCTRTLLEHFRENIPGFRYENWRVIPNGFDAEDFEDIVATKQDNAFFNIAFSGTTYSHLNSPEPLFKALAIMKKENIGMFNKIRFHHIGQSMLDLEKLARDYGVDKNIKIWGYQKHGSCLNILAGMDALIFILDSNNPQAANTIGGKVYEYLRLGLPILGVVPHAGEAADLLRSTRTGVDVDSNAPQKIADILKNWIQNGQAIKPIDKEIALYERKAQAMVYGDFLSAVIKK